uniref:Immunoglobulin V-set domain-containing protein n=1 Tax=Neovison vison TaxID=452646 RepID=A0A8C7BRM3_NEOVI
MVIDNFDDSFSTSLNGFLEALAMCAFNIILFVFFPFHTGVRGMTVEQSPSALSLQEGGSSSVINCSYSDSTSDYFPWYKQELGKGPQLLTYIRSTVATKEDQRLTLSLNRTAKRFSLHIRDTQPEDSAVYFSVYYCAMNDTVTGTVGGAEYKL